MEDSANQLNNLKSRLDSLSTIILDDQCSSKYSSFNKLLMQRLRTASQASPSEQRAKDEHARWIELVRLRGYRILVLAIFTQVFEKA